MDSDELMKYIYDARNVILKETEMPISAIIIFKDKAKDAQRGEPRFTILSEDPQGNPKWEIETLAGESIILIDKDQSTETDIDLIFRFTNSPTMHLGKKIETSKPEDICQLYIKYLENLVNEAKSKFTKGLYTDIKESTESIKNR